MSEILKDLLTQKAVYWAPTSADAYGDTGYADPIEIDAKWTDSTSVSQTGEANTNTNSPTLYTDYPVVVNGWAWRGSLVDAPNAPPKRGNINSVQRTDSVEDDETLYTVSL